MKKFCFFLYKHTNIFENLNKCMMRLKRESNFLEINIKNNSFILIYLSVFIKLDGLGSPLRFIFEGGLRPDGFGIPVEPIVIFVRAGVAFVFAVVVLVLVVLLEVPVVLTIVFLLRL